MKSCENSPTVYLFVARKNEGELCNKFSQIISTSLNMHFSDGSGSFINIFTSLMELGRYRNFNLIIDEFQEFFYINLCGDKPQTPHSLKGRYTKCAL